MNKVLGAIVITAVSLTAASAFAENTVSESRARLAAAWDASRGETAPEGGVASELAVTGVSRGGILLSQDRASGYGHDGRLGESGLWKAPRNVSK